MIFVGSLLLFIVLFSLLLDPLNAYFGQPAGAIIAGIGLILGLFATIGVAMNVEQHKSLRPKVIKGGFRDGAELLRVWLVSMGVLLAAGLALALLCAI